MTIFQFGLVTIVNSNSYYFNGDLIHNCKIDLWKVKKTVSAFKIDRYKNDMIIFTVFCSNAWQKFQ